MVSRVPNESNASLVINSINLSTKWNTRSLTYSRKTEIHKITIVCMVFRKTIWTVFILRETFHSSIPRVLYRAKNVSDRWTKAVKTFMFLCRHVRGCYSFNDTGLLVARMSCRKIVVLGVLRLPACLRCAQENWLGIWAIYIRRQ